MKKSEPVIVHAHCVRIGSHSNSDKHELYRDEKEREDVKKQDPLVAFRKKLIKEGIFTEAELDEIDAAKKKELLEAHTLAMKAPNPTPESIHDFVFAPAHEPQTYVDGTHNEQGEPIKFIAMYLMDSLKKNSVKNPNTFIWGQDMANKDKGGISTFQRGCNKSLEKNVSLTDQLLKIIFLELQMVSHALEKTFVLSLKVLSSQIISGQLWSNTLNVLTITGDQMEPSLQNVVIRLASGGYIGGGLYHSQNLEGNIAGIPGVRVVCPAFADDAAGLLRTAMHSEGPTLYLEPKALYNAKQAMAVVPENFEVPFGKARVRKEGSDLTVVTYGNTVHHCS